MTECSCICLEKHLLRFVRKASSDSGLVFRLCFKTDWFFIFIFSFRLYACVCPSHRSVNCFHDCSSSCQEGAGTCARVSLLAVALLYESSGGNQVDSLPSASKFPDFYQCGLILKYRKTNTILRPYRIEGRTKFCSERSEIQHSHLVKKGAGVEPWTCLAQSEFTEHHIYRNSFHR